MRVGSFFGSNIKSQARGFLVGRLNLAERGADGVALVQLDGEFFNFPFARRGDGHGGLVRLDLDQILVGLNRVAGLDEEADDVGLGDGFAKLRHDNGNVWHINKLQAPSSKLQRSSKFQTSKPIARVNDSTFASLVLGISLEVGGWRLVLSFSFAKSFARRRRRHGQSGGARPTGSDDTARACPWR